MKEKNTNSDLLVSAILKSLDDAKAIDIKLLDLRKIENTVCDYFVICTGTSNTHTSAISGITQKQVSKLIKEKPFNVEGEGNSEWILMDYVNVVVHIFQRQPREFYDLENLWGDAKVTTISSSQ
ncbi:MAG: ribosome silencing factor [Flavobacteriaceae bacterium]|nr:ribosome silencing factor [Flavobacteriaceae bacterium]